MSCEIVPRRRFAPIGDTTESCVGDVESGSGEVVGVSKAKG